MNVTRRDRVMEQQVVFATELRRCAECDAPLRDEVQDDFRWRYCSSACAKVAHRRSVRHANRARRAKAKAEAAS